MRLPSWSSGRVVLLGDAAHCASPVSGLGTSGALVGAYVLAAELAVRPDDPATAFAAYERRMRAYAGRWQKGANPGRFLAPATRRGLALRNRLLALDVVQRALLRGTKSMATDAAVPDYA